MTALKLERFGEFFEAVHGHAPYPWQVRLTERAVNGDWPGAIDLPTGSGKTACIDIAIFAQACQASLPVKDRTSPRRLFFCVNRRVIVDEAYQRARRIAGAIWRAERDDEAAPVLRETAAALRTVGGTKCGDGVLPLDVLELRGGIYRDNRWARSITQPTVVCTTIDQLGSRLLFRGYGVSSNAAPIQAALIAYDSLILLDEAHISEPFRQTLEHVRRYLDPQKWAEHSIGISPVTVVPMTATPNDAMKQRGVITLQDDDRQVVSLKARLSASKPAELRAVTDIAKEAVAAAIEFAKDQDQPKAVGIIVNRVATARGIYAKLREHQNEPSEKKRTIPTDATIELVIGSMRPIDRDEQSLRLRSIVGPDRPKPRSTQTSFVVATQCLEVGADYDFDVLIIECASLDALRQRFGRLNRAGRQVEAKADILASKKDLKPEDKLDDTKPLDPIYGNSLARTWNWLNQHATKVTNGDKSFPVIDFGIDAFDPLLQQLRANEEEYKSLLAPSAKADAPVMLPAYVEFWCQTAPQPVPDPDISLFIHGPQRGEPDVQICWRADLIEDQHMTRDQWCDVVALVPPTAAECMSVPISRLRRWLSDQMDKSPDHGDMLGISEQDDQGNGNNGDQNLALKHPGVLWRGVSGSKPVEAPGDLRPGDTLVLPVSAGGWDELGHIPPLEQVSTGSGKQATNNESASQTVDTAENSSTAATDASRIDDAEDAFRKGRDRAVLRLHESLQNRLPEDGVFNDLFDRAKDKENPPNKGEWVILLKSAAESLSDEHADLRKTLEELACARYGLWYDRYPDNRGFVLTTRRRIGAASAWFMPTLDEGEDERSRTQREHRVLLTEHTDHVLEALTRSLRYLALNDFSDALERAARLHDIGKADDRFQAMLRPGNSRNDACLSWGERLELWAKSPGKSPTLSEYRLACARAELPRGFRHEMLSVQLAELSDTLPDEAHERDLVLHLIAAHHGHVRPFAPVVIDDEMPAVEVHGIKLDGDARRSLIPSHRLDSGVAERFWSLTRRYGWWGLAYLEAVLRLADQQASAAEDAGEYENAVSMEAAEVAE